MVMQNKCFICSLLTNSQYVNNRHANKQIVNSEIWSLYYSVTKNPYVNKPYVIINLNKIFYNY